MLGHARTQEDVRRDLARFRKVVIEPMQEITDLSEAHATASFAEVNTALDTIAARINAIQDMLRDA